MLISKKFFGQTLNLLLRLLLLVPFFTLSSTTCFTFDTVLPQCIVIPKAHHDLYNYANLHDTANIACFLYNQPALAANSHNPIPLLAG